MDKPISKKAASDAAKKSNPAGCKKSMAKPKATKVVKVQDPIDETAPEMLPQSEPIPIPKPRKSRAKPKPTKEEMVQLLSASSDELQKIICDLKDDEAQLLASGLVLKRVPELMKETLSNLEEDMQEINEHLEELASVDVEEPLE